MKISKNWRTNIILFFILLFGAAILSRLFFLQILERKLFQAQALGQQTGFASITGSRGQIFCKNSQTGETKSLAINKDNWSISVSVRDVEDKEKFAETLSETIGMEKSQIMESLNGKDNYAVLKKDLPEADLDKVKNLGLKGLSWQNNPERFYPQGEFASQVLGFLGGEGNGQYGVEGYYDDVLQGKSGVLQEKTGLDALLSGQDETSLDGKNITLTIDYGIQLEAEQLLKKTRKNLDIDAGQIIVMDPNTGKIIALANYPNFDPNKYSKQPDLSIFQNSATQKLFEPGSIMKPFTMAAALNEGKLTPATTYVDTGVIHFGTKAIHNFANEKYGVQTMTQVLENSINTGAVYAQQQLTHEVFYDYLDKFGFFRKTDIDLQGEVYSRNEALKNGPDMNYATASFGQGVELTPLQIARAFCAIANGGKLVKPFIIEGTKPEISSEKIISQQADSQIKEMLISVVDNGFNHVAKIPGYYFAGKTGTAQVPLKNGRGYDVDKTIQSFVGFGPALNPQFLVLVKLDDPKVAKSALSAVPVFKELAQYIINYWKIPPDYDASKPETK